jgi:hypothetical protein
MFFDRGDANRPVSTVCLFLPVQARFFENYFQGELNVMARRNVVAEKIVVHDNGDKTGKGEIYWTISANAKSFSERSRKNIVKVKDGETLFLGDDLLIGSLDATDTLTVEAVVSEKDGIFSGSDESAGFKHIHTQVNNWGVGNYSVRLQDKSSFDVTFHYRIETA